MSGAFAAIAAGGIMLMFAAELVAGAAALLAWGTGIGMRVAVLLVLLGLGAAGCVMHRRQAAALADRPLDA